MKTADEPHATRRGGPVLLRNGNRQGNPLNAPRCGAKTRSGQPCRAPAMANGRCRMHGGKSTGPRTPAGLERSRKANLKHGLYSAEYRAEMAFLRQLRAQSLETVEKAHEAIVARLLKSGKVN